MQKEYLSITEVCSYLGVSKSYVYKLSFNNSIPKYCPGGKLIFMKKSDVDNWLCRNRIASEDELYAQAELETYKYRRASK
jgi:excisionase family DNA binding protein